MAEADRNLFHLLSFLLFWLSSAALMTRGTFWKIQGLRDNTSWFWNFVQHQQVVFFPTMLLKLRGTGNDLQNSGLVWWVLGASLICIPLFNSHFLEPRHPLSSHLCVYSVTELGTLEPVIMANDENVSMCDMTCMSRTEGVNVSLGTCAFACLTVRVWFFSACTWLPDKAYWWQLAWYPVWALAAEGSIGRQWHSAEPPLLFSCENDRPTQKAVQASQPRANSITD